MDEERKPLLSSNMYGYHVYQDIWTPVISEELTCIREPRNIINRYAVAVLCDDSTVVGHLPWKHAVRGGIIACRVTGVRRNCYCIPEGALDVLIFQAKLLKSCITYWNLRGWAMLIFWSSLVPYPFQKILVPDILLHIHQCYTYHYGVLTLQL